jgi:hypothetical protein
MKQKTDERITTVLYEAVIVGDTANAACMLEQINAEDYIMEEE